MEAQLNDGEPSLTRDYFDSDTKSTGKVPAPTMAEIRKLFEMKSTWANKLENDPDLEFLHERKEFKKLVAELKGRR